MRQPAEAFRFVTPDAVSLSRRVEEDRMRSDDGIERLRASAIRIARKGEGLADPSASAVAPDGDPISGSSPSPFQLAARFACRASSPLPPGEGRR